MHDLPTRGAVLPEACATTHIAPETSRDVWGEWAQGVRHCTVGTRTVSGLMLAAVWCAGGAGRVARVLARCGGGAEAAAGHRVRGVRLGLALIGRRGVGLVRDGDLNGGRGSGLAVGGADGHGFVWLRDSEAQLRSG